jgi:hypothetical protein
MTTDMNYIILTATLSYYETGAVCFLCTFCLSVICFDILLRTCNCKQWLEHQQSCENHSFSIGDLEQLDAISLIEV